MMAYKNRSNIGNKRMTNKYKQLNKIIKIV